MLLSTYFYCEWFPLTASPSMESFTPYLKMSVDFINIWYHFNGAWAFGCPYAWRWIKNYQCLERGTPSYGGFINLFLMLFTLFYWFYCLAAHLQYHLWWTTRQDNLIHHPCAGHRAGQYTNILLYQQYGLISLLRISSVLRKSQISC